MLVLFLIVFILLLGILEKIKQRRNLKKIPIRININGIRGKSTITRFIYAILKEDGYKVIAKTTGTDARILYWDEDKEEPIIRKPQGANIGEQKAITKKAVKKKANALVTECMAVNPDYQITFQNQLVRANIGVIVNVLEDHLDVMGPTTNEIADAFTATIPKNGKTIAMEDEYTDFFNHVSKKRNSDFVAVDKNKIAEEYLRKFDYIVFPDNVAIALGVSEALNIDKEVALRGMLNAPPDVGAVKVKYFEENNTQNVFVNAFAANEPQSSLAILNKVHEYNYPFEKVVIVLNCRSDRLDRTALFVEKFIPDIQIDTLICTGKSTQMVTEEMKKRTDIKYINHEGDTNDSIIESIMKESDKALVFCVGNIHGSGKYISDFIEKEK